MRRLFLTLTLLLPGILHAQALTTPLEACGYSSLTSHARMMEFIRQLDERSALLTAEVIGTTPEGREIPVLYFSKGPFGEDTGRVKVLIFAQQHGNEQSGKEGALLLASRLILPGSEWLFDGIDLALVPQVNPDGAAADRRRNAHNADLNRDHLVLGQPETQALHRLFDRWLFEVTMDVHEYYPYSREWIKQGYRKDSEVTVGALTNINIPEAIRTYQYDAFLPFLLDYISRQGFSSFEYLPGGPPGKAMVRRSTFDINDGRQSLGSQFTLSFIQEGMNGRDSLDNMQRRAMGQMTGMTALLEFTYSHRDTIKQLVARERAALTGLRQGTAKTVQMIHTPTGDTLLLPVRSALTGIDSVVRVAGYHPRVEALENVVAPAGYLLPAGDTALSAWAARQALETLPYKWVKGDIIEEYRILTIDSIDFEGDTIPCPVTEVYTVEKAPAGGEYILVPVAQRRGNLVVQALEPRSMLGLATYPAFRHLVQAGMTFPVLRLAGSKGNSGNSASEK